MLRNFENIWSKSLVNSEEFAMFAVPNYYLSGLLYSNISEKPQYSGAPWMHTSLQRDDSLATKKRGSASFFVKNIINQIFSHPMPNYAKDLKPGDNSTLTSTQPSEKGKSQLQKLLQSALKKANEKEAENKRLKDRYKQLETELYQKKFYLARNSHFTFSLFEKNNPVGKCDWKKLYEAEMKLREAEGEMTR